MAAKQLIGTRLDEESIEYIDSIKKEGEDRSSCLRRLIKENLNKTDNLEKIIDITITKYVDQKLIIEKLNSTINSNFIELNSNMISTLKIFSDQSLKVSNSMNELSFKMNDILKNMESLSKNISDINFDIRNIKSDINTIKKDINKLEISE